MVKMMIKIKIKMKMKMTMKRLGPCLNDRSG